MNYNEAFEALQRETNVELEDPMLSQLHHMLVELGDYKAAEDFMEHALASEFGKYDINCAVSTYGVWQTVYLVC